MMRSSILGMISNPLFWILLVSAIILTASVVAFNKFFKIKSRLIQYFSLVVVILLVVLPSAVVFNYNISNDRDMAIAHRGPDEIQIISDGRKSISISLQVPSTISRIENALQQVCLDGLCSAKVVSARHVRSLKELVGGLDKGDFIYNRVREMWRDQPTTVFFRLAAPTGEAPTLPKAAQGETATGSVPVTPEMSVELSGSEGLVVEPKELVKKKISDLSATTWQWKVTPILEGPNQLLTLSVFVHIDDGAPYTLKTYEDNITVNVGAWQSVKDVISNVNPVWTFVVAAVPAISGIAIWLRRRLKPKGQPPVHY
ncbi:hypothetical protein KXR53_31775 [Inquilinus limosus]|uniref:hypothetical protein n=1 Tax=Inquilinus limosus TaxID=171674 RepID=UPI003F18AA3A